MGLLARLRSQSGIGGALTIRVVLSVLLGLFIIYPLLTVFVKSLFTEGTFTLANYAEFFSDADAIGVLLNTFYVALPVTLISTLFGFVLAYSTARMKIPGSALFRRLALFPLMIPPFLAAFGVLLFLGRNGVVTDFLHLGWNIHGWSGIVLVQSIIFIPYIYLTLEGSVQSLDPTMEEVSRDLGANELYTFKNVTLALLTPSLLNSALIVFVLSMADFGTPLLIGGRFEVLSVSIYKAMVGTLPREVWAAVQGAILLIPLLAVYALQAWLTANKSYITITGSSSSAVYRETTWLIRAPIMIILGFISVVIVALIAVVIVMSFVKTPLVNYTFTLENYPELFTSYVNASTLIQNSLQVSAIAAGIGVLVGLAIAYVSVRFRSKWSSALEYTALAPFAIPGTVFGVGYILAFSSGALAMTGTWYILAINVAFHNLPVAVIAGKNQLQQIDREIEEASRDLGASWLQTLRRILLPIWKPALYAGALYVFVTGMRTISAVIFLVSPQFNLLATRLLDLLERFHLNLGTSMATVLIALVLIVQAILYRLSGRKEFGA